MATASKVDVSNQPCYITYLHCFLYGRETAEMTKPTPALTKTCSVCGLQKPLSAFLQLTERGTTYGSICSSCRHDQKDKDLLKKVKDDTSSTSTGMTIDAKARVKSETDKRDLREQVKEEYHEERDKEEVLESRELDKTELIRKEEKKHREHFLSRRPTTSTNSTEKKTDTAHAVESRQQGERVAQEAKGTEKTAQLDHVAKEEQKERGVDFTIPFIDTQIVGKVKHTQNPELYAF